MKKLSNTETELKKGVAYKKVCNLLHSPVTKIFICTVWGLPLAKFPECIIFCDYALTR